MLKEKKIFKIGMMLLGLSMLLSLSGCKHILAALNASFKKPTVRYDHIDLKDISFAGLRTIFHFKIKNDNMIGIKLATMSYDLSFDGHTLFKDTLQKGIEIRENSESPLQVPFQVKFTSFVKALSTFFQKRDEVPYRLKITFGIDTPLGIMNFPFDLKGNVPIPKLPKVEIVGAKLANLSFMSALVNLRVRVQNRGKFPIKLKGFHYNVFVSGKPITNGQTAGQTLAVGRPQEMNIALKFNVASIGMAILNVIRSKKLPYKFDGVLDLGLFKQPINLQGTLQL